MLLLFLQAAHRGDYRGRDEYLPEALNNEAIAPEDAEAEEVRCHSANLEVQTHFFHVGDFTLHGPFCDSSRLLTFANFCFNPYCWCVMPSLPLISIPRHLPASFMQLVLKRMN
jgi:hypothetical protein